VAAGVPEKPIDRVARLAREAGLPEVEVSASHDRPCLRVRGKPFVIVRNDDEVSLMCSLEHKEFLMAVAPATFYETLHYSGWPAVICRLAAIGDGELAERLTEAWIFKAPRRLGASFRAN
jgi:hypothetical protein